MNTRTSASPPHAEFFPPPRAAVHPAAWIGGIVRDFRELARFWPVVSNMVMQDLRVKYQRSVLGFFWSLLNPILMLVTFTLVFSTFIGESGKGWQDYSIYLFSGMVPWSLLACSLNECAFCIINNEGLIRKIYIPKLVFPLTRVLINLVTFVLSMAAMFLLLVPLGAKFSLPMLILPLAIALLTIFSLGLGLILATMNTFFRDCSHLVSIFLQAWYFATPILYYPEQMASKPWLLALNPVYPIMRLFQVTIRDGQWPDPITLSVAAGIAAVTLGVGYAAFKSHEDKLVFRL
jgi:ABC-type polysaccharide/polyol phosphate export permease